MKKEFDELQNRMIEKLSIYKNTKLHPFYLFGIGELDWNEMIDQVSINLLEDVT